jgi:Ca2+-binding RTX toxin-like protein
MATLTLSIVNSDSVTEGNSLFVRIDASGIGTGSFAGNPAANEVVTATIQANSGSATSGADFSATNQIVSFSADGFIVIPIAAFIDNFVESTEGFSISLTNPISTIDITTVTVTPGSNGQPNTTVTNVTRGPGPSPGVANPILLANILDGSRPTLGEQFGTVGFGNTTVINVTEGQGSVTIPVLFSGAFGVGNSISVTYSTQDGSGTSVNNNSAVDGQDYIGVNEGTLNFPSTTAPFTIPITIPLISDTDVELTEGFTLSIDSINGAAPGGTQRILINIIDDDGVGGQPIVDPFNNPQVFFPLDNNGTVNNDILFGTDANNVIFSYQGEDQITGFGGNDILYGGQGQDTVYGNQGNDTLYGNKDNDFVYGGQGDDILYGGQGDDLLQGNDGNDFLSGDLGIDSLVGGAGADRFRIRTDASGGYDYVADFEVGIDRLVLVNGLQFSDLNIAQGSGGTVITLGATGETLEVLGNIQVGSINSSSFING